MSCKRKAPCNSTPTSTELNEIFLKRLKPICLFVLLSVIPFLPVTGVSLLTIVCTPIYKFSKTLFLGSTVELAVVIARQVLALFEIILKFLMVLY